MFEINPLPFANFADDLSREQEKCHPNGHSNNRAPNPKKKEREEGGIDIRPLSHIDYLLK